MWRPTAYEIHISGFRDNDFLAHRHAHLFTYRLWLLSWCHGESGGWGRGRVACHAWSTPPFAIRRSPASPALWRGLAARAPGLVPSAAHLAEKRAEAQRRYLTCQVGHPEVARRGCPCLSATLSLALSHRLVSHRGAPAGLSVSPRSGPSREGFCGDTRVGCCHWERWEIGGKVGGKRVAGWEPPSFLLDLRWGRVPPLLPRVSDVVIRKWV